jgi:hypothetical protein
MMRNPNREIICQHVLFMRAPVHKHIAELYSRGVFLVSLTDIMRRPQYA